MNKNNLIALVLILGYCAPGLAAVDTEAPRIVHEPCEEYQQGDSFEIWARFYDDSPIFDPKVHYRVVSNLKQRNKIQWVSVQFLKDGPSQSFVAKLKLGKQKGRIEYFIEVFDENGNGPALFGNGDAPIIVKGVKQPVECVQVPKVSNVVMTTESSPNPENPSPQATSTAPASTASTSITQPPPAPAASGCDKVDAPFYCSPIVWVGVGAIIVAGAGIGTYYLIQDDEAPPSTNKPVSLVITAPDPSQSLDLRR